MQRTSHDRRDHADEALPAPPRPAAAAGPTSSPLRLRAEVWALALARAVARRLPIALVSWLGGTLAARLGPWGRRHRRVMSNLRLAFPALAESERGRLARRSWDNYGRTVAESFVVDRIAADPARVELADPDRVRALLAGTRGAVFVGLHYGNWEATVIPAGRLDLHPIGIYKPLKNPEADAFLLAVRRTLYPGGLMPATRATVLKVARHVRGGGSVCLLADHRDRSGAAVPFFGLAAPSTTLPALLAVSASVPLLAARVERLAGARFRVHVAEIAVAATGDREKDVALTTAAIQAQFEDWIRERPDLWVWCYKRWDRVRPPGAARA